MPAFFRNLTWLAPSMINWCFAELPQIPKPHLDRNLSLQKFNLNTYFLKFVRRWFPPFDAWLQLKPRPRTACYPEQTFAAIFFWDNADVIFATRGGFRRPSPLLPPPWPSSLRPSPSHSQPPCQLMNLSWLSSRTPCTRPSWTFAFKSWQQKRCLNQSVAAQEAFMPPHSYSWPLQFALHFSTSQSCISWTKPFCKANNNSLEEALSQGLRAAAMRKIFHFPMSPEKLRPEKAGRCTVLLPDNVPCSRASQEQFCKAQRTKQCLVSRPRIVGKQSSLYSRRSAARAARTGIKDLPDFVECTSTTTYFTAFFVPI